MFEEPLCPGELDSFIRCALDEPMEHFECGDEGVAALQDGYCDWEQQAFATCVQLQVAKAR